MNPLIDLNSKELHNLISSHILDIISVSVIVTDLEGCIVFWNKGAESIFGYKKKEVLGKTPGFIYPNRSEEMLKNDIEKMMKGQDYIGEWEGRRKDGEKVWVNIKMTAIHDKDKNIIGFIGISEDITEKKQTVKELLESEIKYQTIFENSGEGLLLMTDKFIDCNKKLCEMWECSKKEVIGKGPGEFSPKFQDDGLISEQKAKYYIEEALHKGYKSFYWQHLTKKGNRIETKITLSRIKIKGGQHLIAVVQDLSELFKYQKKLKAKTKELVEQNKKILKLNDELNETNTRLKIINRQIEQSEKKFRVAFKTSPDAVSISRMSDGLYLEINEGFTQLTGYTEKDVKGKTALELELWVNQTDRINLYNELEENEYASNLEARFRKKDGTITTALMSASIIEINNEKYILSITRDISDRKEYEEKLREAMKKAEESDMLKSAFLANMSHEIRTPMNAILGFSQLLKEKKSDINKQNKFLDIIIARSKSLLQIINDIIDISKIEANQLIIEMNEFSLNKVIYELYSNFQAELITQDKNDIKLIFNAGHKIVNNNIRSDEFRLKQILTNLISNAVKFTEKGKIEFGYKLKNNELEFFVSDTGIGISKDVQKHIFDRFRQADVSSTREFGGTGLGLAICKQLVEMLGGRIWVKSDFNKNPDGKKIGSTFYFTIPFSPVQKINKDGKSKKFPQLNLSGKNILIAEDDIISMEYLEEILQPTNVKIIKAFDGLQAVEKFKNEKVDLILMDIRLPRMNGNDVTKEIKRLNKSVPVIAQSAFAMPDDKKESFKSGCDEYITKPIDSKLLLSIINKFLI